MPGQTRLKPPGVQLMICKGADLSSAPCNARSGTGTQWVTAAQSIEPLPAPVEVIVGVVVSLRDSLSVLGKAISMVFLKTLFSLHTR